MRISLAVLLTLSYCLTACHPSPSPSNPGHNKFIPTANPGIPFSIIVRGAREYTVSANLETRFCFLFDTDAASSTNRFMVYDLEKDSVMFAGKAAHGRCNRNFLIGRKYSDEPGCGCTALGKYKTGASYYGRFGLAYKLYGLDSTNRNAFRRNIVLHGHECIPGANIEVLEICQSDGCPMVAPDFIKQLHALLTSTSKPVLLWIYKSQYAETATASTEIKLH